MRLGKRQLHNLSLLCSPGLCFVAPSREFDSLIAAGLMKSAAPSGGFVHLTANGLRAVADAADKGLVQLAPDLEAIRKRNLVK